ncbi:hypothetical protein KIW84_041763 [Lathyrus oleraceus]|uniref:Uncharacterized protein n=1 Tax=Pisum sativum TaxID=3888 RepID=A0A9D4XAM5_PEA|nr:hypothetical protein KIW84_041763 [Pisum sativum]
MVEVEAQRLEVCFVKRKEVVFGWLVFLLFLSPVVGLRPLRDKTGSGGDEGSVELLLQVQQFCNQFLAAGSGLVS